jgi:hypothetical protein
MLRSCVEMESRIKFLCSVQKWHEDGKTTVPLALQPNSAMDLIYLNLDHQWITSDLCKRRFRFLCLDQANPRHNGSYLRVKMQMDHSRLMVFQNEIIQYDA